MSVSCLHEEILIFRYDNKTLALYKTRESSSVLLPVCEEVSKVRKSFTLLYRKKPFQMCFDSL